MLIVTTSGISGVIDASGNPQTRVNGGSALGTVVLPLRNGITPATVIAAPLQQLVSLTSALGLIFLAVRRRDGVDGGPNRRPLRMDSPTAGPA